EGTVIVEFAVNDAGRVTAVFIKQSCRWPLLNRTALQTVYNWNFPPGAYMTLEVPIVFKIQ
ncbi:MAG: energy transducer TonB, partial [Verrucomicrobiaceae bacterium]